MELINQLVQAFLAARDTRAQVRPSSDLRFLPCKIYLIEKALSVKKHKLQMVQPIGFLVHTELCFYSNTMYML